MGRLIALLAIGAGGVAAASLLEPDEPMAVPAGADGQGKALPFNEFKRRFITLTNQLNPDLKRPDGKPTDRDKLLALARKRQSRRNPGPNESAILATDLLRLGKTEDALDLLKPLYDDRQRRGTRTYAVCAALIHAHALRNEWNQALGYLPDLFDAPLPSEVPGWTKEQRDWFHKLDETYLPHYLTIRRAESDPATRPNPETEEPTPLFPLPVKGHQALVRFTNEAGQYEPGKLAKAEQAKLPPDALAITQQFLFWFPGDTRLYWLLAELYAAGGQIEEAQKIFDEIAGSRRYGNRKVAMEHRAAIAQLAKEREEAKKAAEAASRQEAEKAAEDAMPISLRGIWIYFGVVVVIGAIAVARALARRRGARS